MCSGKCQTTVNVKVEGPVPFNVGEVAKAVKIGRTRFQRVVHLQEALVVNHS